MALFKYLQRSPLPNPNGPLSDHVPPSTIAAANKEVKPLLEKTPREERGKYYVYTEEEKFLVGKRAAEMGVTNTIRHFHKKSSVQLCELKVWFVSNAEVIYRRVKMWALPLGPLYFQRLTFFRNESLLSIIIHNACTQ